VAAVKGEVDDRIGRVIGGCRVERLLGRGGMGCVYLARQVHLARPVALKILDPAHAADEVYRARFLLEARIAARVEHENVVAIYDAGEDQGELYLVLQLVAGGDLASHALGRRLPPAEVARIGLQVARALAAAWAEGIVHLDVKPANVLRSDRDRWKVADFGIARRVAGRHDPDLSEESAAEEEGTVSGSPPYMPPEQWQGLAVDGRTDLYALGVTLWQLMVGRLPVAPEGKEVGLAWYRAHVAGPRVPLAPLVPGAPPALIALVSRLVARDPSQRPPSAAAVVDELDEMFARGLLEPGAPAGDTAPASPPFAAEAGVNAPSEERSRAATTPLPLWRIDDLPTTTPRPSGVRASSETAAAASAVPAAPADRRPPARVRTTFTGRDAERAAVARAVHAAKEGRGAVVLLSGPPGVGRTRLLHEVAVAASAEANVLRGRGSLDSPMHAVRHILRGLFDLERDGTPEEMQRRLAAGIARLVAPGAGVVRLKEALTALLLGGPISRPGSARDVPIVTLAALVRAKATRTFPVVVAVDQLEECDRPTLEFLSALAALTPRAPLVLAIAVKEGELGELALAAVAAPPESSERREVARMSPEEIAVVARTALGAPPRPPLPESVVQALVRRSEGLPRIAVAAAREAFATGAIRTLPEGGLVCDVPAVEALAERAARWLAQGSPAKRAAAETFARATAAPPSPVVPDSASRAIDRHLSQGVRLRDFHDLPGATKQLELALARVASTTAPVIGARVRLEMARTLRFAGSRLAEAGALAARASEQAVESGDRALASESAIERALALYLERRYEAALQVLDEANAAFTTSPGDEAASRANGAPSLTPERARRLACEVEHVRGLALDRLGGDANARASRAAFWLALRGAGAMGDADLFGRVCQSLGEARRRAGDEAHARSFLSLSARYKERLGDLAGLAMAYGSLARLARDRGDKEAAADLFRRDLAIALTIGDHRGAGVAANSLGELHEERYLEGGAPSALDAAREAYDEGRVAAQRSGNPLDQAISAYYEGRFICRALAPRDASQRARGIALLERSRASLHDLGRPELVLRAEAAIAAARRGA